MMTESERLAAEFTETQKEQFGELLLELKSLIKDPNLGAAARKCFYYFANLFPVFAKTFTGNSMGNFYEGQRNIGVHIYYCIKEADRDAFYQMLRENDA